MSRNHEPPPPGSMAREDRFWMLCAAVILGNLGLRALRYSFVAPPAWLDQLLGALLALHFRALMLVGRSLPAQGLVVSLLALALLFGRWRGGTRSRESRGRRRWPSRLAWVLLAVNGSLLLDIHPETTWLYLATLASVALARRYADSRRFLPAAVAAAVGTGWLLTARSSADVIATLAWVLVATPLVALLARRFGLGDLVATLLAVAILHQGVLTLAPSAEFSDSRRILLGSPDPYSFCEVPGTRRLFAVMPTCTGEDPRDCRNDVIVEYDAGGPSFVRKYEPFDDRFYGRMLHLACLDDALLVGMSFTRLDGAVRRENVMELDLKTGTVRRRDVVGAYAGHRLLLDTERGAAFVVSEYSNTVFRASLHDARRPPQVLRIPVSSVQSRLAQPTGSLQTEVFATHAARGTGFFAEWIGGSRVSEVDLTTGNVVATYAVNSGGVHSLAVDQRRDRLIAASLWGIDVFDLRTRRALFRTRTELGPRLPVVDQRRGLVYVTTTFGNHIWVFDSTGFSLRGKLPVGAGARNAQLGADGAYLFSGGGGRLVGWRLDRVMGSLSDSNPARGADERP